MMRAGGEAEASETVIADLVAADPGASLNGRLGAGMPAADNFWAGYFEVVAEPEDCRHDAPVYEKIRRALGVELHPTIRLKANRPKRPVAKFDAEDPPQEREEELAGDRAWTVGELPELSRWIDGNREALDYLSAAARRPAAYRPVVNAEDGTIELIQDIVSLRELQRLFTLRATRHLGEGRPREAQQDLLTAHRIARHVGRGATMTELLVAFSLAQMAVHRDMILFAHGSYTPALAREYGAALDRLPAMRTVAEAVDLGERAYGINIVRLALGGRRELIADLREFGPYWSGDRGPTVGERLKQLRRRESTFAFRSVLRLPFDWPATLVTMDRGYDRFVEALRMPPGAERDRRFASLSPDDDWGESDIPSWGTLARMVLGTRRTRGRTLGEFVMRQFNNSDATLGAAERLSIQFDLHRLALAAAVYRMERGELPASLDQLAGPKRDVYSGEDYRFRVEGERLRLWSVGRNGIDDGGRALVNGPPGDDIRLEIDFRPLRDRPDTT